MDSADERFQFAVCQMGSLATRHLDGAETGQVIAVFDGSFYVDLGTGLICVGHADLGLSPLNLVAAAPATTNWPASGLRLNAHVRVHHDRIRVGDRFLFRMEGASEWSPAPVPADWTTGSLMEGLAAFRAACEGLVPDQGLGVFILSQRREFERQSVAAMAETSVAGLRRWLHTSFREPDCSTPEDLRWVYPLIGLGPGLTPSGSDFLGGMMIALHALGEPEICRRLWRTAKNCARKMDNPIVMAHLEAAAEGLGSAAVHQSLAAILTKDTAHMPEVATSLTAIGHTSGWDAMAGATTVIDVRLLSRASRHT